jgi:uncharacterized membrane protein
MEAKRGLTLFGHRLHPPLTDFPIALWSVSLLWDGVGLVSGDPFWIRCSFWSIAVGLLAALPTLAAGILDYVALPENRPAAERTAQLHMLAMLSATALFAGSLIVRFSGVAYKPSPVALVLSALGFIVLLLGGWLGGELVFRHGIPPLEENKP